MRVLVKGYGSYLPTRVMTNDDLAKTLDTNDDWITERTGIKQRHIAADGEFTSHLAAKAALQALENAALKPEDIDLIIVATATPDNTLPSTATKVQSQIGMTRGAAFDINAACSGFVYGLEMADSLIKNGKARRVLLIGAEIFSRILDWKDRSTCILFGDGAGAWVLEGVNTPEEKRGILFTKLYSDGRFYDILNTSGGTAMTREAGFVTMNGKEVFRHAVAKMSAIVHEGLAATGLSLQDVDWVVPHQANTRILQSVARQLGMADEKFISTVSQHANTSAASIPLAVAQAMSEKKIKPGQLLVIPALGAGLTWGACILRW